MFVGTISTRMWFMLKNKKEVIATIMGDKQYTDEEITTIMVEELMNEM